MEIVTMDDTHVVEENLIKGLHPPISLKDRQKAEKV